MMDSIQSRLENFLKNCPIQSHENILMHPLSDKEGADPILNMAKTENNEFIFSHSLMRTFLYVRNLFQSLYNTIDGKEVCVQEPWQADKNHPEKPLHGGGVMTVIRGDILEKSAVNMSVVAGPKYPAMEGEFAGKPFQAGGVSLISHPKNPNAPIIHLNVRCIEVKDGAKIHRWIGGGADLTPMVEFEEDTKLFHDHMKECCERNITMEQYEKYKKWADDYFYIPHRKEMRGVGGIFFDFVPVENEKNFHFLLDVAQYAAHAYAKIMARRVPMSYNDDLKEKHLYWRGRYAEFNLAYDRGTRFGLMSGGNAKAILCSLPPIVKW